MKDTYIFIVLMVVSSCAPSKEEKAIADYVQTEGNAKTDLSFELMDMKFIRDVNGIDSVKWHMLEFSKQQIHPDTFITLANDVLKIQRRSIRKQKKYVREMDSLARVATAKGKHSSAVRYLDNALAINDRVKKSWQQFKKDSIALDVILKYRADSAKVLAKHYDVVYKIKNPSLNNAEQEITQKFYLSPDGTRVLAIE